MEETELEKTKSYGKFKSAEELLAAYNALEREFTKRCQLIKELKAAGENACAQEDIKAEDASIAATGASVVEDEVHGVAAPTEEPQASGADNTESSDESTSPKTRDAAPTDITEGSTTPALAPIDVVGYCAENADACADGLSEIPQVMDACIAKYKQKLISMGAAVAAVRGAAVITPVRRPKTLQEAKRLADEMLRD